jgi:hypothetical protein
VASWNIRCISNVRYFQRKVLEYAMIRGSKFPVSPRLWLGDKLKGLKNTSDSNLEILLNAIKEGDEAIMDFNYLFASLVCTLEIRLYF